MTTPRQPIRWKPSLNSRFLVLNICPGALALEALGETSLPGCFDFTGRHTPAGGRVDYPGVGNCRPGDRTLNAPAPGAEQLGLNG